MTNHLRAQQLWNVVDPTASTEKSTSPQKSPSSADTTRETRAAEKPAALSTDDLLRAAKAIDLIESHISEDLLSMLLSI